ncbi:MAG: hypothetical protein ACK55I_48540, partial [bacterium]
RTRHAAVGDEEVAAKNSMSGVALLLELRHAGRPIAQRQMDELLLLGDWIAQHGRGVRFAGGCVAGTAAGPTGCVHLEHHVVRLVGHDHASGTPAPFGNVRNGVDQAGVVRDVQLDPSS